MGGYYLLFFAVVFFVFCAFVFWSLISCFLFKSVEHDSCCVCSFVYYLFSLSLVPLTRNYWGIEFVASVMYALADLVFFGKNVLIY